MYKIEQAELKDVDLLLDMKLDIVFNSEEIAELEKSDMEKIVNYTEEEIRENLTEHKLVYSDGDLVAAFSVGNYEDGKIIDSIYVLPNCRRLGIATWILNEIINNNFKPLYLWVDKNNDIAINMFKKKKFIDKENEKFKVLMKNENQKEENNRIKIKIFEREVGALAQKYGLEYKLEVK